MLVLRYYEDYKDIPRDMIRFVLVDCVPIYIRFDSTDSDNLILRDLLSALFFPYFYLLVSIYCIFCTVK